MNQLQQINMLTRRLQAARAAIRSLRQNLPYYVWNGIRRQIRNQNDRVRAIRHYAELAQSHQTRINSLLGERVQNNIRMALIRQQGHRRGLHEEGIYRLIRSFLPDTLPQTIRRQPQNVRNEIQRIQRHYN